MSDAEKSEPESRQLDPNVVRRRRLLLGLTAFALLIVIAAGVLQLTKDKQTEVRRDLKLQDPVETVVLERFSLTPVKGERGRGLAELVRRGSDTALRVLAVDLKKSVSGEVYQLLLTGGKGGSKLLGSQKVTKRATFVGEADVTSKQLHKYRRIELRRLSDAQPPSDRLVLRGRIPD